MGNVIFFSHCLSTARQRPFLTVSTSLCPAWSCKSSNFISPPGSLSPLTCTIPELLRCYSGCPFVVASAQDMSCPSPFLVFLQLLSVPWSMMFVSYPSMLYAAFFPPSFFPYSASSYLFAPKMISSCLFSLYAASSYLFYPYSASNNIFPIHVVQVHISQYSMSSYLFTPKAVPSCFFTIFGVIVFTLHILCAIVSCSSYSALSHLHIFPIPSVIAVVKNIFYWEKIPYTVEVVLSVGHLDRFPYLWALPNSLVKAQALSQRRVRKFTRIGRYDKYFIRFLANLWPLLSPS